MSGVGRGQHRLSASQHGVGLTESGPSPASAAQAPVVMLVVLPMENSPQNSKPCSMLVKRSGNSGRYLSVLNWLSENGLSSETCGRL